MLTKEPGPEVIKLFPAEHEILPANKQQITGKYCCFLAQFSWAKFSYAYEYENANISWHFPIYQQRKFHAQLNWAWNFFITLGSANAYTVKLENLKKTYNNDRKVHVKPIICFSYSQTKKKNWKY